MLSSVHDRIMFSSCCLNQIKPFKISTWTGERSSGPTSTKNLLTVDGFFRERESLLFGSFDWEVANGLENGSMFIHR